MHLSAKIHENAPEDGPRAREEMDRTVRRVHRPLPRDAVQLSRAQFDPKTGRRDSTAESSHELVGMLPILLA